MQAVRDLVQRLILASPFACSLAIEGVAVEPDQVRVRLPFSPQRTTIGDLVHGGAIAALVDVAATAACWSSETIVPGSRGTTVGFSIQFLNAARASDLEAAADVVHRGRSLCTVHVIVRNGDEIEVARAMVTYKLDAPRNAVPSRP